MSNSENQLEQLEKDAQSSIKRGVAYERQFVSYQFEYNSKLRSLDMKEQLVELNNDVVRSAPDSAPDSAPGFEQQSVEKEDNSAATVIKRKALEYRERYHSLETNEKGVVSLGLNSILDVSFNFPDCQSKLFTSQEWLELRKQYRQVEYNTTEYDRIRSILQPVFQAHKQIKPFDTNWVKMYKEAKKLEKHYDPVFSPKHADVAFCVFFVMQVLSIIRYNPSLFATDIDSSEWDFVVKFWGPITERLFRDSGLRLKWGDTHLTLNDTVSEAAFKVDLRVINDKINQRYNVEHDIAVLEAAEENAGNAKFIFDRFKISIENKAIIDKYLLDGALLSSVNSLQISGLDIHFLNTTLQEPGLYVTNELHCHTISKSLASLSSYLDLALHLLCFRDDCVSISNTYNEHLINQKNEKKSKKRKMGQVQPLELTEKQESIRGTWNPPRSNKSRIPPPPKNLWKSRI